jgi:outer membrane protein OmpA-like peptidoglycan-associated protein
MGMRYWKRSLVPVLLIALSGTADAADIDDAIEHPMISRYPGQEIRWQSIDNFREYRIPVGPVTGYRSIDEWIDLQGRVTRTLYVYPGTDRAWTEIFLDYRKAFLDQGFELLADGSSDTRRGVEVGSGQWMDVYLRANPPRGPGEVGTMAAGTATAGGQGVFIAMRDRAAGPAYVVVTVEQHAEDYVGTLIDIVEVEAPESGLVAVDAEAIGSDLEEKGRVVLDGLYFDFDAATLQPRSDEALENIAAYLAAHPDSAFHVVGHTDARGAFGYNRELSQARAQAVVDALVSKHGIARKCLNAHGVGPLVPVFSNASDAGRERNRRVELVERP